MVDDLIAGDLSRLVAIRHDLHVHPQLGYEETHASAVVRRELKDAGVEFEAGLAETGVVGWITPGDPAAASRAAIGLRADMDALPIEEQTGLPYASKNPGLMHACGHDGHTTILIGAARVLAGLRDRLPRPVKLIFQPAEEGGAGAKRMMDAGALSEAIGGHAVAMMLGIHGVPQIPIGTLASRPGPFMAATANFAVTIRGVGGHGAMAHLAADPIVAAAAIVTAMQTIVSRNVDPTEPAALTVGSIHAGVAHNVIPDCAELIGTFRTLTPAVQELMARRIEEVATQTAAAHRCNADVKIIPGYPVTENHPAAYRYASSTARAALGERAVLETPRPIMAGEDFSFYGAAVPSCFSFLGVRPPDRGEYPNLHTPQYDFTDAAIPVGVKLMCRWALESQDLPT